MLPCPVNSYCSRTKIPTLNIKSNNLAFNHKVEGGGQNVTMTLLKLRMKFSVVNLAYMSLDGFTLGQGQPAMTENRVHPEKL